MAGPTLNDITEVECPPQKPFKCLPYGTCHGFDSYCERNWRDVVSCFPLDLEDDDSKLLSWCRDVTQGNAEFPDPSCQFACHSRFNTSQLIGGAKCSSDTTPAWIITTVCIALLITSLILNVVLLYKKWFTHEAKIYRPVEAQKKSKKLRVELPESSCDQSKDPEQPAVNLRNKRSTSLSEGEKSLKGTTKASLHDEDEKSSLGVTVRSSYGSSESEEEVEEDGWPTKGDPSAAVSFSRHCKSSSMKRPISKVEGKNGRGCPDGEITQTTNEKASTDGEQCRELHWSESNEELGEEKSKLVTNLQPYETQDLE